MQKNLSFSSGVFWGSFVERKTKETLLLFCRTANRQTVYSASYRFLAVFESKKKIVYRAEIWKQIVYIGYCDIKNNT